MLYPPPLPLPPPVSSPPSAQPEPPPGHLLPPYPLVPIPPPAHTNGAVMPAAFPGGAPRPSGLAIASLVTSLMSWILLPIIGGIIAVVLGHSARSVIRRSHGTMDGDGMALAGLIIGYLQIVVESIALLCVLYFVAAFASG